MKIDLTTVAGLVIAFAGIGIGYLLEGGSFVALLAVSPILIIFGGTIGVVTITMRTSDVKQLPKVMKVLFTQEKYDYLELIDQLCDWSAKSRKEGLNVLDSIKEEIQNPFVKRGLDYVLDGNDSETVEEFMDKEIESMMDRHHQGAQPFEQAGGFAPTMGIVGTVLGLIVVLAGLGSSDIAELGHGIATAFLATFMGVASANLAFLPFGAKLKVKSAEEVLYREIAKQGLLAIQTGENHLVLRKRLLSYLPDYLKAGKEG